MTHESEIRLEGASNVRDLGWLLRDGGPAGRPRLIRSANLDRLSEAGFRQLALLEVATVIDLRGVAEAAAAPAVAGASRVHLPIEPTVVAELRAHLAAGTLTSATAIAVMEKTYRHYILERTAVFAEVLHQVIAAQGRAVLFHCAAGKDRTGVAAALIMSALGVARERVMADYLLSNLLFRPLAPSTTELPDDVRAAILGVRPEFLEAAFAAMTEGWGSPQAYLERALGIGRRERAALKANFAGG
jgi:protein-tyrosine phosphatase